MASDAGTPSSGGKIVSEQTLPGLFGIGALAEEAPEPEAEPEQETDDAETST